MLEWDAAAPRRRGGPAFAGHGLRRPCRASICLHIFLSGPRCWNLLATLPLVEVTAPAVGLREVRLGASFHGARAVPRVRLHCRALVIERPCRGGHNRQGPP